MGTGAETLGRSRAQRGAQSIVAGLARSALASLDREAFTLAIAALYAIALLLLMPGELVQDTWAMLVAGREISQHGLPHHETLTAMGHGVQWVDQQWLAHIAFYELFRAGGYRLILLANAALAVSAFVLGLVAARRRGASPFSVFLVAIPCAVVAPWGWQLRAQTFASPLFVIVLWLLISDSRRPSRRVFLVLPLLALWANLHGSVVLGAALVSAYGATYLVNQWRAGGARPRFWAQRGFVLLGLPAATVLCSPYGLSVVGYYHRLLFSSNLDQIVVEWRPPTPSGFSALFYLVAFGAIWCVARWGRGLTGFEKLALIITLAAALDAIRNIIWFGFAALIVLPLTVDEALRWSKGAHRPVRLGLVSTSLVGILAAASFAVAQPSRWYTKLWPDRPATAVAAAARDHSVRVFADDRYADWLLWRRPDLAGRVAFDIRFELLARPRLLEIYNYFNRIGPDWQAASRGFRIVVIDRQHHERVWAALRASRQMRQTYVDPSVAVLVARSA
jgi:hypothetical protein